MEDSKSTRQTLAHPEVNPLIDHSYAKSAQLGGMDTEMDPQQSSQENSLDIKSENITEDGEPSAQRLTNKQADPAIYSTIRTTQAQLASAIEEV